VNELPVRKHPRLKTHSYSQIGSYFVTFCVKDRHEILGEIVGRGILDAPHMVLSEHGTNLCNTIDYVNKNSDNIVITKYVIMPNHVHLIVNICNSTDGASGKPRPANALIPKLISSIKRYTNKLAGFNMWQRSYHDRIIRDETEYQRISQYIGENPAKWPEDEYFIIKSP